MSASVQSTGPPQPSSGSRTTTTVVSTSPPTIGRSSVFSGPGLGAGAAVEAHLPPSHRPHGHQGGGPASAMPSTRAPQSSPADAFHVAQQAHISQARAALVASIGNMLDHELQTRSSLLHSNQAAIESQERDLERALADLRRKDDKLLKVLNQGSKQVKELGDVQNWAERLERDFLVLEETMRLVARRRDEGGSESGSRTGSGDAGAWSGSDPGDLVVHEGGHVGLGDGDVGEDRPAAGPAARAKGKQVDTPSPAAMDTHPTQPPLPLLPGQATGEVEPGVLPDLTSTTTKSAGLATRTLSMAGGWLRRMLWIS